MHQDARIRRAIFIDRSVEIREQFHYADSEEVLKAISVYCCDGYGSMLWALASEPAQQYFRAWNTAVKLVNDHSLCLFGKTKSYGVTPEDQPQLLVKL